MKLKFLPNEGVWFSPSSEHGFEIVVGGNEQSPDGGRLRLVEWVLRRVSEVRSSAEAFLDSCVDRQSLGNSEWWLEGFEFGRNPIDKYSEFDVVFTTDEGGNWQDCRLWFVKCDFVEDGDSIRVIPIRFQTKP